MRAYIQSIDFTTDDKIVVSGQLSRLGLEVKLIEHIYIEPPHDGVWGFNLEVIPVSNFGPAVMVPFVVEATWTGDSNANGVRIIQPALTPQEEDYETVLLKAKKVTQFTNTQENLTVLEAASYDKNKKQLIIDVAYGGGCFPHQFELEWDGLTLESFPVQYHFKIVDKSDKDPCQAFLGAQLRFDIDTSDIQLEVPSIINLGTYNNSHQIRVKLN